MSLSLATTYNKSMIKAWEANHDIRYVTSAHACIMQLCGIIMYVMKSKRAMGHLLKNIVCELHSKELHIHLKLGATC